MLSSFSQAVGHESWSVSYSQYIAVSLCCFFLLTHFLCSSMGSLQDTVPSGISICSGTSPPWAAWQYLLCHGAPSPPLTLVFPLLFLILFPFLLCLSLNMFSQRCYQLHGQAQLCPVMGLLEVAGNGYVWHRTAPSLFSKKPSLQPPPLPASGHKEKEINRASKSSAWIYTR